MVTTDSSYYRPGRREGTTFHMVVEPTEPAPLRLAGTITSMSLGPAGAVLGVSIEVKVNGQPQQLNMQLISDQAADLRLGATIPIDITQEPSDA